MRQLFLHSLRLISSITFFLNKTDGTEYRHRLAVYDLVGFLQGCNLAGVLLDHCLQGIEATINYVQIIVSCHVTQSRFLLFSQQFKVLFKLCIH